MNIDVRVLKSLKKLNHLSKPVTLKMISNDVGIDVNSTGRIIYKFRESGLISEGWIDFTDSSGKSFREQVYKIEALGCAYIDEAARSSFKQNINLAISIATLIIAFITLVLTFISLNFWRN